MLKDQPMARDLGRLTEGLPPDLFVNSPEALEPYARDWTGDHYGLPLAVVRPRSVEDLATVMRRCHELRLPVVPQGGLTGLVGAAVPAPDRREVVVSLERMTAVRSIDPVGFAMVVEAGCILEIAKRAAEERDCLLPITFGAQGSCRIGGNVSTNAGGFNVLRYGMTRDLVLGLEVVLSDGRVWNGLRTLRKNNTGYDLKQLFIGAEGTLGIVTAAALKLFPKPTQVETAWIGLRSVEDAMALHAKARRSCSDLLSAFELILRDGLEVALAARSDLADPLDDPLSGLCPDGTRGKRTRGPAGAARKSCLEDAGDLLADGTIAASRAQGEKLWLYREVMVEAQGHGGPYFRTDVSVPIPAIPAFLEGALAALRDSLPDARAIAYGHVGDGNIHLNVIPPADWPQDRRLRAVRESRAPDLLVSSTGSRAASARSTASAARRSGPYLDRVDPVSLDLATRIRAVLDPIGLLSPGRIFGDESPT